MDSLFSFASAMESMKVPMIGAMESSSIRNYKTIKEGMQECPDNPKKNYTFRVNDNYRISISSKYIESAGIEKVTKAVEISLKLLPEAKKLIAVDQMAEYRRKTNKDISESEFVKNLNLKEIRTEASVSGDSVSYDITFVITDGGLFSDSNRPAEFEITMVKDGKKATSPKVEIGFMPEA